MLPSFSTSRLSLVDRGFIYAIAHIRGGKDKGYRWYREGKLLAKRNSFTDFIDVARHLIAENYTSAGRIIAQGPPDVIQKDEGVIAAYLGAAQ